MIAMKKSLAALLAAGSLVLGGGALLARPAPRAAHPAAAPGWENRLSRTADGDYLLGNPAAKVKVVEFISYTCPHCADFNGESAPLRAGPVHLGAVSVEIRPFLRNNIDVVASLLALCGPENRFLGNHDLLLARQKSWLKEPGDPAYKTRWANPDFGARSKAVAQDLGLYALMQGRGYSPAQLDACLSNQALAQQLAKRTDDAAERIGVIGTPSFTINGKLQEVYAWAPLRPLIEQAIAASR